MRFGLIGCSGKLGMETRKTFEEKGHTLVYQRDLGLEDFSANAPDVLIDCSLPDAFPDNLKRAEEFSVPFIIAVTALTPENIASLKKAAERFPVVQSFNFSVGVQALLKLAEMAGEILSGWDIEIEEIHHNQKKDKPSGTAIMIKDKLKKDVNISSLRLGGVPGEHTVFFGGAGETVKISHSAISRRAFSEGILKSAEYALKKKNGFYSFTDVVFNK